MATFNATDSTSGDISFINAQALSVSGITQQGTGNVTVSTMDVNTALTVNGNITGNENVTLQATGNLTVASNMTVETSAP